jgi:hypothetical protein
VLASQCGYTWLKPLNLAINKDGWSSVRNSRQREWSLSGARTLFSSLATAAGRPRSFARSFCFPPPPPPPPPLHSHRTLKTYPELTETQLTGTSHRRLATNPCHRKSKAPMRPLQPQQRRTTYSRRSHTCRHSLVMLGACSATEFSRPPAQLAGSLPVSRPSQKAPGALPTLYIHHSRFY